MAEVAELKEAGILKEWWAPGAVLGLMGFGTTTMATGLHNVGWWGIGPTLAMALAFGGTAQFIAGVVHLRKGGLFPGTAFASYGAFWWALFLLLFIMPMGGVEVGRPELFGFFLMWTIFTVPFTWASIKHGKLLFILFVLLLIAFILLTIHFSVGFPAAPMGWEIFVLGLLAWYIAGAELLAWDFGRNVWPLA